METTGVEPIRPPAPYYGGKRRLAHRLAPLIDQIPHEIYCEPFVGMGGVFFRRRLRPRLEIINDYNRDVITLFRVLQRHCSALLDVLAFAVTSRDGLPPSRNPFSHSTYMRNPLT